VLTAESVASSVQKAKISAISRALSFIVQV
jgi:hypothetical protein